MHRKHYRGATTQRIRGLICPFPEARPTEDASQCIKCLHNGVKNTNISSCGLLGNVGEKEEIGKCALEEMAKGNGGINLIQILMTITGGNYYTQKKWTSRFPHS